MTLLQHLAREPGNHDIGVGATENIVGVSSLNQLFSTVTVVFLFHSLGVRNANCGDSDIRYQPIFNGPPMGSSGYSLISSKRWD